MQLCRQLSRHLFLPVIMRRSSQSSEPYQPEPGCTGVFVSSSPRRAYLVAGKAYSMEWQDSVVQAKDDYHHIRCISPGLGSSHQWYQNRGSTELLGAGMHINYLELLAATLAAKTFLKSQTRQSALLQLDNQTAVAYIYQQHGSYSVPLTDRFSQNPLDVGPVQQH